MPKRRVLFDAGPMLDIQKTGVGYYVDRLMNSLQRTHAGNLQLTGYYFDFLNRHHKRPPAADGLRFCKVWLVPGKLLSLCRRLGFQPFLECFVRQKSDAVIFTNYVSLPQLRRRKTILVVYDLGFLDVPEYTQGVNLAYLKRFCPPSVRRADTILTISEFTKNRLRHHFPGLRADIVVTPIPPSENVSVPTSLSKNLSAKGIKKNGYILYLGTIEPRKNLQNLIAAYARLDASLRSRYALVLAGGQGWKDEAVRTAISEQQAKGVNIILTGYVNEEEKSALYANAVCFVLPSHYEGFGMPIFEAMQHNVPVAVSDIPVFHEVAGDAASYFDKDAPGDIAAKLAAVLTDENLRKQLITAGQNQLRNFSWQDNADTLYRSIQ